MDDKSRIIGAVVGGYLLGRTKKGKAALQLAFFVTGRPGLAPRDLARRAGKWLADSAGGAQLVDQLRGPLLEAGKRAVVASIESRADALSDSLRDRTRSLTEPEAKDG